MQQNRISAFAFGRHTFHLIGDRSPGWPSTVGWIKINKHVNRGQGDSTCLSSSLFQSVGWCGLNEMTERETFIEDKSCVLIKTIEKASACQRSPWELVTTLHLNSPHSHVCLLWLLSLQSHSTTWSFQLKTLTQSQIPGQSHCISICSSLNLRGRRETCQSNFFLL